MPNADGFTMNELDRYWDEIVQASPPTRRSLDPKLTATIRELHGLDHPPAPDPAFADRLWQDLMQQAKPAAGPAVAGGTRRARWWTMASLAAAVVAVALVGSSFLLSRGSAPSGSIVASPTYPVSLAETSTPPSATPTHAWGAVESPTPILPTPTPSQRGRGVVLTQLAQEVNAADFIVVGRVVTPGTPDNGSTDYYQVDVVDVLRGSPLDQLVVHGGAIEHREVGGSYVFFLTRNYSGRTDAYRPTTGGGVVPLEDGGIISGSVMLEEVFQPYAGQPLAALAEDIRAIPPVEPAILDLLAQHDWKPIGKQWLWPVEVPQQSSFADPPSGPGFPFHSWAALNAASKRTGLDFSQLAGQEAQVVVYAVERAPTAGVRGISAEFVIKDQQVVGAWIDVDGADRPFGLDERDAVLGLPALLPAPTPMPTPTATPSPPASGMINPVEFYDLHSADSLVLCWPYCSPEEPVEAELQASIVEALDQELPLQEPSAYPTPGPPVEPTEPGDYLWLVFEFDPDGRGLVGLGYRRAEKRIWLPNDIGWVEAPAELAAILDQIEPPPAPTKP